MASLPLALLAPILASGLMFAQDKEENERHHQMAGASAGMPIAKYSNSDFLKIIEKIHRDQPELKLSQFSEFSNTTDHDLKFVMLNVPENAKNSVIIVIDGDIISVNLDSRTRFVVPAYGSVLLAGVLPQVSPEFRHMIEIIEFKNKFKIVTELRSRKLPTPAVQFILPRLLNLHFDQGLLKGGTQGMVMTSLPVTCPAAQSLYASATWASGNVLLRVTEKAPSE